MLAVTTAIPVMIKHVISTTTLTAPAFLHTHADLVSIRV